MSPEVNVKEKLGRHEFAVGYLTRLYEQPLLQGLWDRWGMQEMSYGDQKDKRGWYVCGPGTITLSRIINSKTGIPIVQHGDLNHQEHLRCSPSFFYRPPNGKVEEMCDHDGVEYFNGFGYVTLIDVTGPLTFGDKKGNNNLKGAILLRKIPVAKYYKTIASDYHLYPLKLEDPDYIAMNQYHGIPPSDTDYWNEFYEAKNSDRITSETPFSTRVGQFYANADDRYGLPLAEFIKGFIPGWTGIR
ncbi:MAG TPA: hypothetical protein VLF93_07890 [Candidatus Saccharimonadales bacterium]|nr:hypothetical protein [Candidatus Saccharimonadales bacterium]